MREFPSTAASAVGTGASMTLVEISTMLSATKVHKPAFAKLAPTAAPAAPSGASCASWQSDSPPRSTAPYPRNFFEKLRRNKRLPQPPIATLCRRPQPPRKRVFRDQVPPGLRATKPRLRGSWTGLRVDFKAAGIEQAHRPCEVESLGPRARGFVGRQNQEHEGVEVDGRAEIFFRAHVHGPLSMRSRCSSKTWSGSPC